MRNNESLSVYRKHNQNNEILETLQLPQECEGGLDWFETMEKNGFEIVSRNLFSTKYGHDDNEIIEFVCFQKEDVRIVEIWDLDRCLCTLAVLNDFDFFHLMKDFVEMKNNMHSYEHNMKKLEEEK